MDEVRQSIERLRKRLAQAERGVRFYQDELEGIKAALNALEATLKPKMAIDPGAFLKEMCG